MLRFFFAVFKSIQQIRTEFPAANCVLDAEKLEFISSAGLRIILRLLKELKQLKIINVNSEVYEIFDMTGFTDMLTVEKAFRKISIDGCELIARGGNGCIYRYDEETIVKTYHNGASLDEIRLEKELSRKVFVKGINTAIISLEMSDTQVIQKLISRRARINSYKMRMGTLGTKELEQIGTVSAELAELPIHLIINKKNFKITFFTKKIILSKLIVYNL